MTTNFPTSVDAFTNPSATDAMDSVTVPHATQHANLNDAVEALQAKVGVDGSAVTTSLDYKLGDIGTWTSFTPTWTASGGSLTVSSNNYGIYTVINDLVLIHISMQMGGSGSGGPVEVEVPSAAGITYFGSMSFPRLGSGAFYDASTVSNTAVSPYRVHPYNNHFAMLYGNAGWQLNGSHLGTSDEIYLSIWGKKA